ncbi:MAG: MMPL family transporter [Pseudomonadota bacterium]
MEFFSSLVIRYLHFAQRREILSLVILISILAVSIFFASRLSLKSDLKELLPENSKSVVELNRLLDRMGGVGTLLVAAESPDVEANKRFMDALASKLSELPPDKIRYIDYKADKISDFYEKHFLYYIDKKDLDELYARLKQRVEYEKVKSTPLFFDLMDQDEIGFDVDDIRERNEKNKSAPLSIVDGYYGGEWGRMLIMLIRPYGSTMTVDSSRELVTLVESKIHELNPASYSPFMKVGTCGNVKSTVEEYDTLRKDIFSTAFLCIALVAAAIVIYFLRLRVIFLLGTTLLFGIACTFALTALSIGYLNAQTAFLGSIIVGTGVNYGIIQFGRYLEERKSGKEPLLAMSIAITSTLKPTFLAALTTAISFAVLLLAGIRGLSQFGFIGAVGVMFCWLATIFVLPVITIISEKMRLLVRPKPGSLRPSLFLEALLGFVSRSPKLVMVTALIAVITTGVIIYRFIPNAIEYDFTKMRNQVSVSSGTEALEKRVSKLFNNSMTPAAVLVDSVEEGKRVCEAVMRQNDAFPEGERRVGSCYSIADILPKDQDERLKVMKKMSRLFNGKWMRFVKSPVKNKLNKIKSSILGRALTIDDLPEELSRHFEDLDGRRGAVVFINPRPGMLLSDGRNLSRYADTIREITLDDGKVVSSASASVIYSDLISIIKDQAPYLTIVSFIGVVLFVALTLRRMKISLLIIGVLSWSVISMMGVAAWFGIKINFFNFIVLPLTFGVGVDYALNIAVRLKEEGLEKGRMGFAMRHTGGAVALCSATTIIGYSVLTFANNKALSTFGTAAVIGEVACLIGALMLLPSIIIYFKSKKREGVQ